MQNIFLPNHAVNQEITDVSLVRQNRQLSYSLYSYKENKPIKLKIDPSNWNDVVDTMVGYSLVFGSRADLGIAKNLFPKRFNFTK